MQDEKINQDALKNALTEILDAKSLAEVRKIALSVLQLKKPTTDQMIEVKWPRRFTPDIENEAAMVAAMVLARHWEDRLRDGSDDAMCICHFFQDIWDTQEILSAWKRDLERAFCGHERKET